MSTQIPITLYSKTLTCTDLSQESTCGTCTNVCASNTRCCNSATCTKIDKYACANCTDNCVKQMTQCPRTWKDYGAVQTNNVCTLDLKKIENNKLQIAQDLFRDCEAVGGTIENNTTIKNCSALIGNNCAYWQDKAHMATQYAYSSKCQECLKGGTLLNFPLKCTLPEKEKLTTFIECNKGACINMKTDVANCGKFGNHCGANSECVNGVCVSINRSDVTHCGASKENCLVTKGNTATCSTSGKCQNLYLKDSCGVNKIKCSALETCSKQHLDNAIGCSYTTQAKCKFVSPTSDCSAANICPNGNYQDMNTISTLDFYTHDSGYGTYMCQIRKDSDRSMNHFRVSQHCPNYECRPYAHWKDMLPKSIVWGTNKKKNEVCWGKHCPAWNVDELITLSKDHPDMKAIAEIDGSNKSFPLSKNSYSMANCCKKSSCGCDPAFLVNDRVHDPVPL